MSIGFRGFDSIKVKTERQFVGVYRQGRKIGLRHYARIKRNNLSWTSKCYESERDAAIAYDKKLIELGELPVNILKKK